MGYKQPRVPMLDGALRELTLFLKDFCMETWTQVTHLRKTARPVGSLYLTTDAANPAVFFGGTWVRLEDACLFAPDDALRPTVYVWRRVS